MALLPGRHYHRAMLAPYSISPLANTAIERRVCTQRIRVALAALQCIAMDSESLSNDVIYMLKDLAESDDELELESDALARAIIGRESLRLGRLIRAA